MRRVFPTAKLPVNCGRNKDSPNVDVNPTSVMHFYTRREALRLNKSISTVSYPHSAGSAQTDTDPRQLR